MNHHLIFFQLLFEVSFRRLTEGEERKPCVIWVIAPSRNRFDTALKVEEICLFVIITVVGLVEH